MRWSVAGEASDAVGHQVFDLGLMNGLPLKLRRPAVTNQTIGVRIGAFIQDGLCPRPRYVAPPVSQAVQFGLEGTVYSIGGMAGVALMVCDPFVGVVFSRQRGALR